MARDALRELNWGAIRAWLIAWRGYKMALLDKLSPYSVSAERKIHRLSE